MESKGRAHKPSSELPETYSQLVADIKRRIQNAQLRASLAVNRELVLLYWQIGRDILTRQERENWGAKIIDRLAADLKIAIPDTRGLFAPKPQIYARFAEAWPEEAIVQQLVAQMSFPYCYVCEAQIISALQTVSCR